MEDENGKVLKTPEEIKKTIEDTYRMAQEHDLAIKALGNVDEKLGAFGTELKEINTRVADIGRSRLAGAFAENGFKIPFSKEEFARAGMKAVTNASTGVTKNPQGADRPYTIEDGPIADFQEKANHLYILKTFWQMQGRGDVRNTRFYREVYLPSYQKMIAAVKTTEALDSLTAGEGLEWDPAEFTRQLWEKVRLELQVANLFRRVEMPRSPYVIPTWPNDMTASLFAQKTAYAFDGTGAMLDAVGATNITDKLTLTAVSLAGLVVLSRELEEDSIVAALPFAEMALAQAIANAIETAIINGDADGTHQDTDTQAGAATLAEKAWNGLRRAGLAGTADVDAATNEIISDANWRTYVGASRGLMGKFGVNGSDLALIASPKGANMIRSVEAFRTIYAFGSQATNVGGPNGGFRPDGMDFVVSEFVRDDMGVGGFNAASGNTKTALILVNKKAWVLGVVHDIKLQVLREAFAVYNQDAVIGSFRGHFASPWANTLNHTGYVFNIGA